MKLIVEYEEFITSSNRKMYVSKSKDNNYTYGYVKNGYRVAISNGLKVRPNKNQLIQKY